MNAWSQQCFIWVNWDFYVKARVADDASCWSVQWDFPTSFPSFWLLCWRVSLESDCKPRCLRQQAAFGSHRHNGSRKLRERSVREIYTQIAFWNFIYPWVGEMHELYGRASRRYAHFMTRHHRQNEKIFLNCLEIVWHTEWIIIAFKKTFWDRESA